MEAFKKEFRIQYFFSRDNLYKRARARVCVYDICWSVPLAKENEKIYTLFLKTLP